MPTRSILRRFVGGICALAVLAGVGCNGVSPFTTRQHTLRIADTSDPNSIDPLLAHDQDTIGWDLLYCETLVGLNARNELVPVLVRRIPTRANGDVSKDGRTITYRLRKNVRFADGVPFTSADVAFTYRAILDDRNNVLSQDAYRRVVSLSTPDAYTVRVRLKSPWNAATSVLFAQADFAFGILPAHAFPNTNVVHAAWEDRAFGTGPFRVIEWRRGDRIVLERNPYYVPKPKLDRIVLQMIPSTNTAFVALRTHEVDVAVVTPDELRLPGVWDNGLRIVRTPENATLWFALQTQRPPTDEIGVRRAIADGLDVEAMRKAYANAYEPAGSFLPPVLAPWYDATVPIRLRNLPRANAELAAAGWELKDRFRYKDGKMLNTVLITFAGRAIDARIATLAQAQLAEIGMQVTIKPFSTAAFNAPDGPLRNNRFGMSLEGWLGGADPEQSVVFSCSQLGVNGNNHTGFCDSAFDRLIADQETTNSASRRRDDFFRIQRQIYDAAPVVPLYYETYLDGADRHVYGFARNMLRYPVDAQTWDVR